MASMSNVLRMALEASKELPLRPVVRVVIKKQGNICLCKKIVNGVHVAWLIPGGGVEDGDTYEETAQKEALEEVGMKLKHIEAMGIQYGGKHHFDDPKRAARWSGSETSFYKAEYAGEDRRHFDTEGDAMNYVWVSPKEAIRLIETGPKGSFNAVLIGVIEKML